MAFSTYRNRVTATTTSFHRDWLDFEVSNTTLHPYRLNAPVIALDLDKSISEETAETWSFTVLTLRPRPRSHGDVLPCR
jgi:hypothetical protein